MSAEDDLKLLRELLTERSVPIAPESFENDDMSFLYSSLASVRNTLIQFSHGNFNSDITGRNVFAATLKTLQANLRHLTWQVGEVAKGDFSQRVDFLGEFSTSFNSMVQQLERSVTDFQASEERWNLAAQCSRDGIWDINIDERTAWYSDNFMQMMRYSPEDLPHDLHWETMIHPDDSTRIRMLVAILQGSGVQLPFSEECRLRTGWGNYLWVRLRGMPIRSENVRRLITVVSDISTQKDMEATLMHQAMYDNLTGLPNRYLLNDRLKQLVANAERSGHSFILVTLDLDFFKDVNDTYGHAAGDMVLVELAKRLSIGLRTSDTIARLGGDEFVAIYPCETGMERATTETVMNRFYDSLKPPMMLGNVAYQLNSSMGVAFFPLHAKDVSSLFQNADAALYKAKKNGKNQYAIYDSGDEPAPQK